MPTATVLGAFKGLGVAPSASDQVNPERHSRSSTPTASTEAYQTMPTKNVGEERSFAAPTAENRELRRRALL
jgi:hypothetical protein